MREWVQAADTVRGINLKGGSLLTFGENVLEAA